MTPPASPRSGSWYVYLLRCADGTLYCGIARDVRARLAAHAAGSGARYTRGRGPLTLLASHRYRDQGTALRIEAAIKRLSREQKMAAAEDARRWAAVARAARAVSR
ncbi:MAG TPA: GIY-YIG nuclease family protein [Polyangia bacterium]|nr:GIY-YIG nuclease family protein [Polyangia bacterium]